MSQKLFRNITSLTDLTDVNEAQKNYWRQAGAADPTLHKARARAYTARWREALVYSKPGLKLLDIGCGWGPDEVWSLVIEQNNIDYHLVDIDENAIAHARGRLTSYGRSTNNAVVSVNTALPFTSASFDMVFSSHCIEHSTDLAETFREIKRVLKPNGILFAAVPLGFDASDEHLLFFSVDEWIEAASLAGFELIGQNIGKLYAISTVDLAMVLKSANAPDGEALDVFLRAHTKAGKTLIDHRDDRFFYENAFRQANDCTIVSGIGERYVLKSDSRVCSLLFSSHEWSGVISVVDAKGTEMIKDLYSRFHHVAALEVSGMEGPFVVCLTGKNPLSKGVEVGAVGALVNIE